VAYNIGRVGFRPIHFRRNTYHTRIENLLPGQVAQLFVPVDRWTDEFTVALSNISPELPPAEQNFLFGDDILMATLDAPTSTDSFKRDIGFYDSDTTVTVDNPQPGIARVAVAGRWTNAGRISADVTIRRVRSSQGWPTARGKVSEGEYVPVEVEIPEGTTEVAFELDWIHNWARFPTADLDLLLEDPSGNLNQDGTTLASPERVVLENPAPGAWVAWVNGVLIYEAVRCGHHKERFTLRVTADGERIH
jgi:hypothetical protein